MATGYYLLDHPQHPSYPQCGYPRRNGAKASGTIILHDAEGGTDLVGADMGAENVARYITERSSFGSYHRLVDRDTRIKMAPIDYETWHSVPDNPWSVGISVAWNKADLAKMTYMQRRSYYVPLAEEVLDVRAEFAARGIHVPIDRMLSAAETQARKPGISTHSRTDPGRRSDPFGTDSVYEREFLAVLAELASGATPEKETFMADYLSEDAQKKLVENSSTAAIKASQAVAKLERIEKVEGERRELDLKYMGASAQRETASLAQITALSAAVKTLAENVDLDGNALVEAVKAEARQALSGLTFTATTKEA